ncbi:MAG: TonB-dependent receptor [Bacteroidales bacterium]
MRGALLIALGLGSCNMIFAEEKDTLTINKLNSVVVTANKTRVNRNNVPLSLSVIERAEIDASSESALMPVLSQHIPGLFVTQKGITGFGFSEGAAGVVNIRGVGQSNKVLMMLDGQPQWAGIFGHSLPDTYVASDVERVEVIRGPGSLLYGSNAMGGVINIITRDQLTDGRTTRGRIMAGSFGTEKFMINNGYKKGGFSSFVSFNHDRTDGHRENSKFNITNGFAKIGYKFDDRYKISADLSIAKIYNHNPGKESDPIIDNNMNILRGSSSLSLENNYNKSSGAFKFFYNWGDHKIGDGYRLGAPRPNYFFNSEDHNIGAMLFQTFGLFKGNTFTVGVDYKNWGGLAWNSYFQAPESSLPATPDLILVDKTVNELAGYLIAQQEIAGKLTINGGIRYENNSVFGGVWVPQIGATLRAYKDNVIKVSVSKGFRSPNIREMYMFPPQNPNLKPENSVNYEISFEQTLLGGDLIGVLTGFYIDGKDMIQVVIVNGRPLNVNTGAFINKGFEVEASYRPFTQMRFDVNYSYLHTSKPLIAAPENKLFINGSYSPGRLNLNLNMMYVGSLYLNTTSSLKESYTLLNGKISYRFWSEDRGLNLFVKGENLTGVKYYINEGFPMPGTVAMVGVDFSF